ncbi:MAG: DUF5074 domain-containing protein [Duncaniella sp.]|nr:DUF5074 domain-containing protein [Duncaniella sp.]
MKKFLIACLALAGQSYLTQAAEYIDWVDWDQIQHWAGDPDGENKCALVIDFQDIDGAEALVWGYRWNGTKTGEDLVRAVASQSSILTAMIQYTGTMGSTLNALGISSNREELDYLHYDFERAAIGGEVSFGFFDPNLSMGQETAPGYDAEQMCQDAIERAKSTGIIEHPLNAFLYGYPAYDYDYWQLEEGFEGSMEYRWRSGWYDGYWSYWHGPNDYDYMGYSGLGMSSTVLTDGCVQAWKYIVFNGEGIGAQGGELAETLDYEMSYWGEEMHDVPEVIQPVDQSKVDYWVGTGEKSATVVFQFNDGRGAENLVYGYRWSGGWDDDLATVIKNIAASDDRMTLTTEGANMTLTYDSDADGATSGTYDHVDTSGTWSCYVKRVVDSDFNKISSGRWLNPNAVMVFSRRIDETPEFSLPYLLYRPAADSEQFITLPSEVDYYLADEELRVPVFIQVPAGGRMNTAYNCVKDDMPVINTASVQNLMCKVTAYKDFKECEGTVKVRGSYVAPGQTKSEYVYSNDAVIRLHNPVKPVTGLHFTDEVVAARLNHPVDNPLVIEPADATYTKMKYVSSNTKVASAASTGVISTTKMAGEADITVTYDFDNSLTASFSLTSSLVNPVEDVTFEKADENDVITLTPKEMTGLFPIFTPADPDIADMTYTLSENGDNRDNYIATMYKVNLWDENKTRTTPWELSGHRLGECKLTVESGDGSGFKKEFTVNVVDPDRETAYDYPSGTYMLNEEWFGHTNGGMNWFSPSYEPVYQVYERENPGMSFGCTSQYGIIYDGKLIVSSKQAADGGDPLPGGGRLVVADASTLKRLGSIDDIKLDDETRSADGRALCGAGPGRVYMGTSNGIYIIDTENFTVAGKIGIADDADASNLYAGQIGDMVLAGHHAFAIKQSTGVFIIDIDTDKVVKTIDDSNVQGITQSADGRVWYATIGAEGNSVFVALDHSTLDESDRVEVPAQYGTVTCGWGAWRSTQFTGAHSVNSIFFAGGSSIANGGSGNYYRYDIDDNEFAHIAEVAGLPAHTPGYKQGAYGTVRYDDRTGEIIAGTTESNASGHYRYNWIHFIDAKTGKFNASVELRPYYWFLSMPLFPDAYDPEVEDIDDLTMALDGAPVEITVKATDRDNNDANIRYSLIEASRMAAPEANLPVEVALEGNKLTLSPKNVGSHTVGIAVESNGKVVNHAVKVNVYDPTTGVASVAADRNHNISSDGHSVTVSGYEGVRFDVVNATGVTVDSFVADSDRYTHTLSVVQGVYILVADYGVSKKIIVK